MILSTLIAGTVAAAEPAAPAQPAAALAPAAEKKMACCDKMAKGEGCDCCKDMGSKPKSAPVGHDEHAGHGK
jgi:hypothetical protein